MTTASSTYALRLSDDELERYRWMAARARAEEGDLWTAAGIVPGARVADVGCGPGAMLVTLAELVGPAGHVVGVDADRTAVTAARAALDPRIGRRLPDLARAAGLAVEEYRGWTVGGPAPRGMRGPAWAAHDELVRAGLADATDVARWDAAFASLDEAVDRPHVSGSFFAAVCRRPA